MLPPTEASYSVGQWDRGRPSVIDLRHKIRDQYKDIVNGVASIVRAPSAEKALSRTREALDYCMGIGWVDCMSLTNHGPVLTVRPPGAIVTIAFLDTLSALRRQKLDEARDLTGEVETPRQPALPSARAVWARVEDSLRDCGVEHTTTIIRQKDAPEYIRGRIIAIKGGPNRAAHGADMAFQRVRSVAEQSGYTVVLEKEECEHDRCDYLMMLEYTMAERSTEPRPEYKTDVPNNSPERFAKLMSQGPLTQKPLTWPTWSEARDLDPIKDIKAAYKKITGRDAPPPETCDHEHFTVLHSFTAKESPAGKHELESASGYLREQGEAAISDLVRTMRKTPFCKIDDRPLELQWRPAPDRVVEVGVRCMACWRRTRSDKTT